MLEAIRGFKIVDMTSEIVLKAIKENRIEDFEDAVQFHSALKVAKMLITRNKNDFNSVRKEVEVLTPEEFWEKYVETKA